MQPIEVVVEEMAKAGGRMEGLEGSALADHMAAALAAVQRVVGELDQITGEENQRKAAALEIEQLLDAIVRSGTDVGKALAGNQQPIADAFKAANLQQLAAGLQQLTQWMANPTPKTDDEAKALLANLEATMGPAFGIDPEKAEQQRRDELKADVSRSLDDIFRGKDFGASLRKPKDK